MNIFAAPIPTFPRKRGKESDFSHRLRKEKTDFPRMRKEKTDSLPRMRKEKTDSLPRLRGRVRVGATGEKVHN